MMKDSSKRSDTRIVRQVLDGDTDAFAQIIERHQENVFRIVSKRIPADQAEEVAHEVFVRTYRSLSGFKSKSSFQNWLAKIAVRTCYDYWRERYRSKELPMDSLSEKHRIWLDRFMVDSATESFERAESGSAAREILLWALEKLSPGDRSVLELVHLEGYSVKEAAEILGWSTGMVKIRAFRSRKKLRVILGEILT